MKTRILYPKNIWFSKKFKELKTDNARLLALYLVSNDNIGLTRIYLQQEMEVCFILSLSERELSEAKAKLEEVGLFFFKEDWVYINNDFSYVDYEGRDRVNDAKEREINKIPDDVKAYFEQVIKGLITGYKPPINHKSKIINHKSETINHKSEGVYKSVIEHFNQTFQRKVSSFVSWRDNCDFWLKTYSLEQINKAITEWKRGGWIWKPKDGKEFVPELDLLFRTQNSQGKCDYIGKLLEREVLNSPETRRSLDPLAEAARRRANQ